MGTPWTTVFKFFLNQLDDKDYGEMDVEVAVDDMTTILRQSIPEFLYPDISLSYTEVDPIPPDPEDPDDPGVPGGIFFNEELGDVEITILATVMKKNWFARKMADTDVVDQKFGESDFEFKSQASHLQALTKAFTEAAKKEVKKKMSDYGRSKDGKPRAASRLTGK